MKNSSFLLLSFLLIGIMGHAQTAFRHVATSANISGNATVLDHSLLNGIESAFIFILPVWDRNTDYYYCENYAQNAGVKYDKATQKWAIVNQDPNITMRPNQAFNVLVMPKENANCFSIFCDDANKAANGFPNGMVIDHPACNNKPNALLLVTQNYGTTYNNNSQLVGYANGKWRIANNNYFFPTCDGNKSEMPIGAKFNVLVIEKNQTLITGYPKTAAFLHKMTHIPPTANIEYIAQHVSILDAPENSVFNTDPGTLIFATPNLGWTQTERPVGAPIGNLYTDSPLVAWQTRSNGKWSIVNATAVPLKEGALINVLAIKQLR